MNRFLKIVVFLALCLCAKEGWGSSAETYRDTIDFNTVSVLVPTNSATANMKRSSPYTITGTNIQTGRTGQFGAVRVINTTNKKTDERVSLSSSTLSCTSQCDSDATQCSISFTPDYAHTYSVPANGRSTYSFAGGLSIPASCGSGVFTGTTTWTGSGLVSATITINLRVYLDVSAVSIVVSKTQDLNFGTVASGSTHNVTINPNGCNISSTVPSGLISTASAKCGIFTIKNEGSSAQALTSVTLPSSITLNGSSSGSMTLDLSTYPALNTITSVPASTTTSVNVGGTLHILNTNPVGTYSGNYTLTVNY